MILLDIFSIIPDFFLFVNRFEKNSPCRFSGTDGMSCTLSS